MLLLPLVCLSFVVQSFKDFRGHSWNKRSGPGVICLGGRDFVVVKLEQHRQGALQKLQRCSLSSYPRTYLQQERALDPDMVNKRINDFRKSVAQGMYKLQGGGFLPGSKSMFALKRETVYENLAMLNTQFCERGNTLPDGASMNYYQIDYLPSGMDPNVIANFALSEWEEEPLLHGIGNDAIYNNQAIQNFANLVYYQSTMYGCYERYCASSISSHVFACVFNKSPTLGKPLYEVGGKGCTKDSDCTKLLPFSKCENGICVATNETEFTSASDTTITPTTSETTTPTSSTESMPTTPTSTTGTEPTTPSSSTGTEPTTPSSSSTGTEPTTSGTATTAGTISTPAMQTPSTLMMPTTSMSYDSSMTNEIRNKIVTMHNYRRSRLAQGLVPDGMTGMRLPAGSDIYYMSYSMELENAAQAYANTCPSSGSSYMGENFVSLPYIKPFYDCAYDAIRSFWSQIFMSSIYQNVMFTQTLLNRADAPLKFTQMAWAYTYQVGCGIQRCGMNTVVVCRYYPRGNILNQRIYGMGPMCSACPNYRSCTTDYMNQGLCYNPTQM